MEVSDKCLTVIKYIFNAILRVEYFHSQWKVLQITVIPKPGKNPMDVASYRPISLLPVLSEASEKLLLKRVQPLLDSHYTIPNHQFGF